MASYDDSYVSDGPVIARYRLGAGQRVGTIAATAFILLVFAAGFGGMAFGSGSPMGFRLFLLLWLGIYMVNVYQFFWRTPVRIDLTERSLVWRSAFSGGRIPLDSVRAIRRKGPRMVAIVSDDGRPLLMMRWGMSEFCIALVRVAPRVVVGVNLTGRRNGLFQGMR